MTDTRPDRDADVNVTRAASAFGSLADENRIEILLALWQSGPLSFADLQSAAGFSDSGHFNYHLDKLLDRFVEKDDGEYRLRTPGASALDIVFDERFGESPPDVDIDVDATCPSCGTRLHATYSDGRVVIGCPDCSVLVNIGYFPPRGRLDRDPAEFFTAYSKQTWRDFTLAREGVCPHCGGRMETTVEIDPDWHLQYPAVSTCQSCQVTIGTTIGVRLLTDPAVVTFLHEHGERVDERSFWEFDCCIDDSDAVLESEEPLRVTVPVSLGAETLRVTVDDATTVLETERVTRR
ncbi:ArsR/SmtB family transcription factor [Halapricum hydrolyticum]|uniref:Helix-turn-helix domain-containing protein n=1 Tax=Halapricum hydrolyticum TaxID=2979991 RepID=A0AAE3I8H0_9EURY|nr:helix-turn-helix transcriptional regulator [Halapricum hydrolyticum]MCU4716775.1 helix-turn-helix domain-containing protein [Halapricum hydrolyticum]MCU4725620.1 helix-turn-helix domain-containing protein [Halapricum hydrolyticum]